MPIIPKRDGGEMAIVVRRKRVHDADDDLDYWLSRTPEERLLALETLRRRVYGIDDASRPRLQRVCRVLHRS